MQPWSAFLFNLHSIVLANHHSFSSGFVPQGTYGITTKFLVTAKLTNIKETTFLDLVEFF